MQILLRIIALALALGLSQVATAEGLPSIDELKKVVTDAPPGTILVFGPTLRTETLGVLHQKDPAVPRRYMTVAASGNSKYINTENFLRDNAWGWPILKRAVAPDDSEWPQKMREFYKLLE